MKYSTVWKQMWMKIVEEVDGKESLGPAMFPPGYNFKANVIQHFGSLRRTKKKLKLPCPNVERSEEIFLLLLACFFVVIISGGIFRSRKGIIFVCFRGDLLFFCQEKWNIFTFSSSA
jgi:hypothetical protein